MYLPILCTYVENVYIGEDGKMASKEWNARGFRTVVTKVAKEKWTDRYRLTEDPLDPDVVELERLLAAKCPLRGGRGN